jgi:hypothetical protein
MGDAATDLPVPGPKYRVGVVTAAQRGGCD